MAGVEEIEEISQPQPPFSVVEKAQDIRKRGIALPSDGCCANNALVQPVIMEEIQHNDQENTFVVIVCHQCVSQIHGTCDCEELKPWQPLELIDQIQAEQGNQKREINVLLMPVGHACLQGIIKGEFRNQRKQKKTPAIFQHIPGVEESLNDQKTKDWKSEPANAPHPGIEIAKSVICINVSIAEVGIEYYISDNCRTGMINKHGHTGDQLKRAA